MHAIYERLSARATTSIKVRRAQKEANVSHIYWGLLEEDGASLRYLVCFYRSVYDTETCYFCAQTGLHRTSLTYLLAECHGDDQFVPLCGHCLQDYIEGARLTVCYVCKDRSRRGAGPDAAYAMQCGGSGCFGRRRGSRSGT